MQHKHLQQVKTLPHHPIPLLTPLQHKHTQPLFPAVQHQIAQIVNHLRSGGKIRKETRQGATSELRQIILPLVVHGLLVEVGDAFGELLRAEELQEMLGSGEVAKFCQEGVRVGDLDAGSKGGHQVLEVGAMRGLLGVVVEVGEELAEHVIVAQVVD